MVRFKTESLLHVKQVAEAGDGVDANDACEIVDDLLATRAERDRLLRAHDLMVAVFKGMAPWDAVGFPDGTSMTVERFLLKVRETVSDPGLKP
jgi:hypothetical protein